VYKLTAFRFVSVSERIDLCGDLCGGPVERVDVAEFGIVVDGDVTSLDFSQRYKTQISQWCIVHRQRQTIFPAVFLRIYGSTGTDHTSLLISFFFFLLGRSSSKKIKAPSFQRGDWKRGTGHRETIKIVGTDIARLDNAAPYSRGGQRETWQRGTRSNIGVQFFCCMEYYMNVIYHIYHFVIVLFVICACRTNI